MKTDVNIIIESIERACDDIGELDLSGIKLENPQPRLLDVQDGSFDEHVAMQPAAIAYYGMLMKHSRRELGATQRAYDHWRKRKFQEAKKALSQPVGGKPAPKSTIADIESYMRINFEKDMEKWEDDVENLQSSFDVIESWYEAWRQKGFSLRELSTPNRDEKYTKDHIYDDEKTVVAPAPAIKAKTKKKSENETTFERIKRMQREKAEKGGKN